MSEYLEMEESVLGFLEENGLGHLQHRLLEKKVSYLCETFLEDLHRPFLTSV